MLFAFKCIQVYYLSIIQICNQICFVSRIETDTWSFMNNYIYSETL